MKPAAKAVALLVSLGALFAHARIPAQNPFKHVVVIVQENRTPDNLFHGLLTWPGINPAKYDLASSGVNTAGQTITLVPVPLGAPYDLNHSHPSFVAMYDGGKMDEADKINCTGAHGNTSPHQLTLMLTVTQ